jgi:hypothetical protein
MSLIWLGALLVVAGLVLMAGQSIFRGRMSGQGRTSATASAGTLEPPQRGVRFLGITMNWPSMAVIGAGVLLMLIGSFV